MDITIRHIVLLVVDQIGDRPNGKTYIQKLCYFIQRLTRQPLGFRPHYYGPYSDQVSAELSFLTATGFLSEARRGSGIPDGGGWEIARYDYSLTDQGKDAVAQISRRFERSEEIKRVIRQVTGAGDNNYVDLSFAAKTDWIVSSEDEPMTTAAIAKAALRFNWNVDGTNVEKAVAFLSKLGLVRIS